MMQALRNSIALAAVLGAGRLRLRLAIEPLVDHEEAGVYGSSSFGNPA